MQCSSKCRVLRLYAGGCEVRTHHCRKVTFGVNANILSLRWRCWLKSGNVIQFAELEDKGLHAPFCKCVARQRLTQVRLNLANRVVIPIPVQSKAGSRGVSMVFAAVSQQISAGYNSGELGGLISLFRWVRFPPPLPFGLNMKLSRNPLIKGI